MPSLLLLSFAALVTFSCSCPQGWRPSPIDGNRCYLPEKLKKIWFDAEQYCASAARNGHLASISSGFETSFIDAIISNTPDISTPTIWIGGNDFEQSGTFQWIDGKPFTYTNWGPGEPHLAAGQCVSTKAKSTGKWMIEDCAAENCFICECHDCAGSSPQTSPTTTTLISTQQTTTMTSLSSTTMTSLPSTTKTSLASTTMTSLPSTTMTLLPSTTRNTRPPSQMTDCYDWLQFGNAASSGVYRISPPGIAPFDVYCDMTTDGGGWTVFQRRLDSDLEFYTRTWNEYKNGFNNGLNNSLWLGNDAIHLLSTKDSNVELRIDLWGDRAPGASRPNIYLFGKYSSFYIDNETKNYAFHISKSSIGNATSSGTFAGTGINSNIGQGFVTGNRGGDTCSVSSTWQYGGWWMSNNDCGVVSLNGKYIPRYWDSTCGLTWTANDNQWYNSAQTRMMLRKIS